MNVPLGQSVHAVLLGLSGEELNFPAAHTAQLPPLTTLPAPHSMAGEERMAAAAMALLPVCCTVRVAVSYTHLTLPTKA